MDLGAVPHRLEEGKPKGGGFKGGPTSIGGRKTQRGVDLRAIPHRLEEEKSANKNPGPEGGEL